MQAKIKASVLSEPKIARLVFVYEVTPFKNHPIIPKITEGTNIKRTIL
jgi:hypothetical protein